MSTTRKYELLRSYFGISGIKLVQAKSRDPNAEKKSLVELRQELFDNGHVYKPGQIKELTEICKTLTQTAPEKRSDKDRAAVRNLISKMNFFLHHPGTGKEKLDLDEVSNYLKYQRKEPGETLFRQGDKAETYYVVLKGTLQVQVPSPFTDHIFIPEEPKKVEKTKKETKKISTLKTLVL